jgi:hypothetical protein
MSAETFPVLKAAIVVIICVTIISGVATSTTNIFSDFTEWAFAAFASEVIEIQVWAWAAPFVRVIIWVISRLVVPWLLLVALVNTYIKIQRRKKDGR